MSDRLRKDQAHLDYLDYIKDIDEVRSGFQGETFNRLLKRGLINPVDVRDTCAVCQDFNELIFLLGTTRFLDYVRWPSTGSSSDGTRSTNTRPMDRRSAAFASPAREQRPRWSHPRRKVTQHVVLTTVPTYFFSWWQLVGFSITFAWRIRINPTHWLNASAVTYSRNHSMSSSPMTSSTACSK